MQVHIEVENLSFYRGERRIFDQLNLTIPCGKVIAVMGPSGTGKTTLLKLIAGQLKPHAGVIRINGENVHQLPRRALFDLRKKMGMLFQSGALLTDLNVFENVAFPLREHTQLSEEMIRRVVLMKLQAVGLRGARDLMPAELSGGMARRVALARAIAMDPEMVMYDEPFVGQDPITMGVLLKLVQKLNQGLGLTSVVVSHDVAEVLEIADYAYVLSEGRVVAEGSAEEIRKSDEPYVRQFLNGLPDGPVPFHYPAPAYREDLLSC